MWIISCHRSVAYVGVLTLMLLVTVPDRLMAVTNQPPTGTISFLSGTVLVSLQGKEPIAATEGMILQAGDTIQTHAGAQALLTLSEGSEPRLGPNSKIDLAILSVQPATGESFGHFDIQRDRDKYIRFTPLLYEWAGTCYPSFALEVARAYLNPAFSPIIQTQAAKHVINIQWIQLDKMFILLDEQGKLLINYYGPRGMFPYYALSDVVLGKIPPYKFADKIVLVGFTSKMYQDLHAAPFQSDNYPGVEINATIIENIIQQDFLTRPK